MKWNCSFQTFIKQPDLNQQGVNHLTDMKKEKKSTILTIFQLAAFSFSFTTVKWKRIYWGPHAVVG